MARLYLNTEITAMPDSDKPRPPASSRQRQTGISLELIPKSFNFYSNPGVFFVFLGGFLV